MVLRLRPCAGNLLVPFSLVVRSVLFSFVRSAVRRESLGSVLLVRSVLFSFVRLAAVTQTFVFGLSCGECCLTITQAFAVIAKVVVSVVLVGPRWRLSAF